MKAFEIRTDAGRAAAFCIVAVPAAIASFICTMAAFGSWVEGNWIASGAWSLGAIAGCLLTLLGLGRVHQPLFVLVPLSLPLAFLATELVAPGAAIAAIATTVVAIALPDAIVPTVAIVVLLQAVFAIAVGLTISTLVRHHYRARAASMEVRGAMSNRGDG